MSGGLRNILFLGLCCLVLLLMMVSYKLWEVQESLVQVMQKMDKLESRHNFALKQYGQDGLPTSINGCKVEYVIKHIHEEKVVKVDDSVRNGDSNINQNVKKDIPYAVTALPELNKSSNTYLPKLDGENVVAMSLWGSEARFTKGAIRNAELIKEYFPGWKLRIYTEMPSDAPIYGLLPNDISSKLRSLGAELFYMDPKETRVPPMMWRFLIADDYSVDRFIVRDADSRLSPRDAAAVYEWVKSKKPFHCVRDHPSHAGYALSGGMWGGLPSGLRSVMRRPWKDIMYGYKTNYLEDMNFLNRVIWPWVEGHAYCSDSVSCDKFGGSYPYPIPRYGYEHVGQVYDQFELSRPDDIRILRENGENPHCSPPKPKPKRL